MINVAKKWTVFFAVGILQMKKKNKNIICLSLRYDVFQDEKENYK